MALAKAGYPMSRSNKQRIEEPMQPWFALIGLVQWANRKIPAPEACGMGLIPDACSPQHLTPQGGNMLLAQLARLPSELAEGIAYQAVFGFADWPRRGCKA